MNRNHRRVVLPLLGMVVLLAASAHADPDDDGEWTKYVPPVTPGSVIIPNTAEGGYSSPDQTRNDQSLRKGVLDQLCRHLKINHNFGFGGPDFSGTSVGLSRALATYPDNTLAVVDDEQVTLAGAHTFSKLLGEGGASVGLSIGGEIGGHTMVIRRLPSKQSCDEVFHLANFADIKTVFPISAERITNMQLGELWRLPFTLSYSQGLSVGDALLNAAGHGTLLTLSYGRGDTGKTSMTLYRIADDKVRFRFRIDHVIVNTGSGGINEIIPAIEFAANPHAALARVLVNAALHEINGQFEQYSTGWLTYAKGGSDGAGALIEFVLDPRDPAQAEALAKAMKGDIYSLIKMGVRQSTLKADVNSALKDYESLGRANSAQLGDPTYAATKKYEAHTKSWSLNIPLLVSHDSQALFGDDKIQVFTDADGTYTYYRTDTTKSTQWIKLPVVGPWVKTNSQRDAEVVTHAKPGGDAEAPFIVYLRNQGYLRATASTVREPVDEINSVLKLVGAQRGGSGGNLLLPVDKLVPPSPLIENNAPRGNHQGTEAADRKGTMSFTLVFNQQAVRDILAAPTESVVKAVGAALGSGPMAEWLAANAKYQDGTLVFSRRDAEQAFPGDDVRDLSSLSGRAADMLADLAAARDAKSNVERSEALAKLIGGRARTDMKYEDVMKVLVQMVDPMDLTGDFVSNIDITTKGVASEKGHLVLKKGRPEVDGLRAAGETRNRFAEPSPLVD
ncbi:MAG: hypothetical protein KGL74_00165 [Elusimicrobia bacterium]|nr:hypothetical protein [Elusimicrobiota bacterium]